MSDHIDTRRKLKAISVARDFMALLDRCMLSDEDKEILRLIYIKEKPLAYIADTLGFSESGIKKRHKKALSKLSRVL